MESGYTRKNKKTSETPKNKITSLSYIDKLNEFVPFPEYCKHSEQKRSGKDFAELQITSWGSFFFKSAAISNGEGSGLSKFPLTKRNETTKTATSHFRAFMLKRPGSETILDRNPYRRDMLFLNIDSGQYRKGCRYLAALNDYCQQLAALPSRGPPSSMSRG
ncbi:hypothetical protein EVAR_46241_1 [Eumeta japonica]|uniref:Uncharacterized protein n=1 Tax=Eumeta variegata TaxID=151549 RepID=A0A4C1XQF9_EUMVA|nr:hypothetical protein EVAR_46241_1 [Eumeta japonica]